MAKTHIESRCIQLTELYQANAVKKSQVNKSFYNDYHSKL